MRVMRCVDALRDANARDALCDVNARALRVDAHDVRDYCIIHFLGE